MSGCSASASPTRAAMVASSPSVSAIVWILRPGASRPSVFVNASTRSRSPKKRDRLRVTSYVTASRGDAATEQVGRGRARRRVVEPDVCRPPAVTDVRDQGDDGDAPGREAADGGRHLGVVRGLEEHAVAGPAAPTDAVMRPGACMTTASSRRWNRARTTAGRAGLLGDVPHAVGAGHGGGSPLTVRERTSRSAG